MHCQSANSFAVSTPPPLRRLQAYREKLLAHTDDWKFDLKWSEESKSPPPLPMPKIPSPELSPPLCSPIGYHHHHSHCHPDHFHEFLHSHDHMHNRYDANSFHEENAPLSVDHSKTPPKRNSVSTDQKLDIKSPTSGEETVKPKKKLRRAKSCPKELFSISSKCSNNEKSHSESTDMNERRPSDDRRTYYIECFRSPSPSSHQTPPRPLHQQHSRIRTIPKIRVNKPKSKTPNSMEEFLSSKLVRSNHAAKLRHKSARKKINELADEKLKATLHVSHFIPKCHTWNVRDTPAWKTFLSAE